MIREAPFVSKWSIVGSFRPGLEEKREGVFKHLRQKGLVSDGVGRALKAPDSGKLQGQLRIFCSLNQDAARLARRGFEAEAQRFVKAASRIEAGSDTQLVADAIAVAAAVFTVNYDHVIEDALRAVVAEPSVSKALGGIADRVDKTRAASKTLARVERRGVGKVTRIRGDLAEIILSSGDELILDLDTLSAANLARLGAPIAIHWEKWNNGQAFMEAESALELDSEHALEDEFPFLRHQPSGRDVWPAAGSISGVVRLSNAGTVHRGS